MSDLCPCQSGTPFTTCCKPYLSGETLPPTAEALMRSRYTAFTLANIAYIRDTRHPDSQNDFNEKETHRWAKDSKWMGFEVIRTEAGGETDEGGIVEFIAHYSVAGKPQNHHEIALFQRHDNRWFFMDGEFVHARPFKREAPKPKRNEPCPCGSGKKFKKCCN
jgi:SEC-C motif domain protein